MNILVVNTGSSSIKSVLYEHNDVDLTCLLRCTVSNIGEDSAKLTITDKAGATTSENVSSNNHTEAINLTLKTITTSFPYLQIDTAAYRIVYGGDVYFKPTEITDIVVEKLSVFKDIDPEHAPLSLEIIELLRKQLPDTLHIACFDTAFFHDIPEVAQIIPIPRKYRELGLRRFGYHGLSYEYLSREFGNYAGEAAKNGRVIYAHLGSGASITATFHGSPVDMTMGLTPSSGLVMGTRSGDIDPSLAWILNTESNISTDEYQHMVNHSSGLLAVSELSADMYTLLQNQATNEKAALAVELFCYQARKAIGSLAATIGGVDSLIFSGGMGEQAPEIRRRICEGLEFLGISINDEANQRHDKLISPPHSQVGVHVIPTDESLSIAQNIISMHGNIKDRT